MKDILKLSIPLFLSTLLNMSLTFLDTVLVGGIGVNAVSSVASGGVAIIFIIEIIGAFIIGYQIMGAKESGKNNFGMVVKIAQNTLVLMYIINLFFIVISLFFSKAIVSLFSTKEILEISQIYFISRLPGLLFMPINLVKKTTYDIQKNTKVGFYYTIIVNISNLFFSYILIYPFKLGVLGSGLGTSISLFVGCLFLNIYNKIYNHFNILNINFKKNISLDIIKNLNFINIPEVLNVFFDYIGSSLLVFMTKYINTISLAIGKISTMYLLIFFSLSMNLAMSIQILSNREPEAKLRKNIIFNAIKLAAYIFVPISLVFIFFPSTLIFPFIREINHINTAKTSIMMTGINILLLPIVTMSTAILRSKKLNKENMYVNTISVWFIQLPIAYIFIFIFKIGVLGIVLSYFLYLISRIIGNITIFYVKGVKDEYFIKQ